MVNLDWKAVAALGVGLVVIYFVGKSEVGKGLKAAGNALSPTNHDNIFATGVNSVGAAVSGNTNFSLGSWVYDLTHGSGSAP